MPSIFDRILATLSSDFRQSQTDVAHLRADVTALKAQMEQVMATQEQFNERMTAMDDATNEIASDLQALRDQLANAGGIPDDVLTTLDAKIARLEVLGRDPEVPVPPVEG